MATNHGEVKVKKDRNCYSCGKLIKKGETCLTANDFGEGRHWFCDEDCYENLVIYQDGTAYDEEF